MKTAYFNNFTIDLPNDAVIDCYHIGRCDDDVEYWVDKIPDFTSRVLMIDELAEYGAWSNEELKALENRDLKMKLIWIAAGNIQEEER